MQARLECIPTIGLGYFANMPTQAIERPRLGQESGRDQTAVSEALAGDCGHGPAGRA